MRRVAALVNAGAHRVTPGVIAALEDCLGPHHVFVTRSAVAARDAMAAVIAGRHDVVCVVGGDGTFVQAARDAHELASAAPPILFALPYGFGNAIADISGASPPTLAGLRRDLARAVGPEPPAALRLLRANGRIAHYAGVGLDAVFVEDLYAVAKGRWRRAMAALRGAPGVVATVVWRTLPRLLRYRPPHVRVIAAGPATPLDRRGAPGEAVPAGTVLHDGPAVMAAGGTIASYGKRFQAFPFADAVPAGCFHLRVWTIAATAVVRHLPAIWRGTYFPTTPAGEPGVHDWAAAAVTIDWTPPHVIHIGGDLEPPTTRLRLEILDWTLPILRG
jgi:diacylglycerol kinase family enzyme